MKTKLIKAISKGLLFAAFCGMSCDSREKLPSIPLRSEFERNPPIVREIVIRLLENSKAGNLLVVADFGKGNLEGQYHAIMVDAVKLTLRDDGEGGDEVNNDGKFSIILTEDIAALSAELEALQKNRREIIQSVRFDFKGRQLIPAEHQALKLFDFKTFLNGRPVILPENSLCFLNASIPHSIFVTDSQTLENSTLTVNPCSAAGNPDGAWTFERLVTDIANQPLTGLSPGDLVKTWLQTWLQNTPVNSDVVAARENFFDFVISPWLISSGHSEGSFTIENWQSKSLELSKAPFKLIAIVNRLDLRGNMGYGITNTGEGRFIFEVLNPNCGPLGGSDRPFTIIFEYGIPINSCSELNAFALDWYNLKDHALGSTEYIRALKKITNVFTRVNADPTKPNGSAINQVRTNEIVLASPWELREFVLNSETPKLTLTTVKQEPAKIFNGAPGAGGIASEIDKLKDWINSNTPLILEDKHNVPLALATGEPFVGGKSHSQPGFWDATGIINMRARHHFSLNTCGGCHTRETGTAFVHLSGTNFGAEPVLSGFLTGITLSDPVSGDPLSFNDLLRRKNDLEDLLCSDCKSRLKSLVHALTFDPIRMEH